MWLLVAVGSDKWLTTVRTFRSRFILSGHHKAVHKAVHEKTSSESNLESHALFTFSRR